jgi:UPF0271 protein
MVDINCDMGELEDAALQAELMQHITSANVACGAHAGDEATMERTIRLAAALDVRVGAHPSFPDRKNFGRAALPISGADLEESVYGQLLRLEAVAARCGVPLTHVKPHGALYNVAARDRSVAETIARAVGRWNPRVVLVGLAGSQCLQAWRSAGFATAAEGFADRRYEADGTLRPRSQTGALITDAAEAARQAADLARRVDTICVHSDTPGAVGIVAAVAAALRRMEKT